MNAEQKLARIAQIIEHVDNRAMAYDGDVPTTMQVMEQREMSEIYALASEATTASGLVDGLCERLQRKCYDWGTYWRAPDAHGVNLSREQALELLRDALGVEVEISE